MKYRIQIIIAILLVFMATLTNTYSQQTFCHTPIGANAQNNGFLLKTMHESGPYYIRIYVHVIRQTNGTEGQSEADVKNALSYLNADFVEHNIIFVWDCSIDYIDSDYHYYYNDANFGDLIQTNSNEDGIDIYLLDDNIFNGGRANRIAGVDENSTTAFVIGGNYWLPPFGSLVKSHVISHEMGHCLGLLHTHENSFGEDDGSNCEELGDFVCDTPRDPGLNHNIDYPTTCVWTNPQPGYDPDEKIIMAYTHPNCMVYFTAGEGERMRNTISLTNTLKQTLIKRKITGIEEWNISNTPSGVIEINGVLEIDTDAQLTIEDGIIVRFAPQSKLIVKQNATLNLHGTLTSKSCDGACEENCGLTWKGIELWGNSAEHQYLIAGVRAQGRLNGYSGALIENAEVAVKTWGNDSPDLQLGFYTQGGGQINCFETTFRNNGIAVHFAPYQNFFPYVGHPFYGQPRDYFGTFSLCTFENDNNYQGNIPFSSFIRAIQSNGIKVNGCSFTNTQTPLYTTESSIIDYGIGVYSSTAGVKIGTYCNSQIYPCPELVPTTFNGLGYGIHADATSNGSLETDEQPLMVKDSKFENCYVGVRSRGMDGITILNNDFKMGKVPDEQITVDQFGIQLEHVTFRINVEENKFFLGGGTTNVTNTIGTLCKLLFVVPNNIRKNYYDDITIGNLAYDFNGSINSFFPDGVYYTCNENNNIQVYDFYFPNLPQFTPNTIGYVQGEPTNDEGVILAAGNTFSSAAQHFIYEGNQVGIKYYYDPNEMVQIPMTYSGVNLVVAPPNSCGESSCEPPCNSIAEITAMKAVYYQDKALYEVEKNAYETALQNGNTALAEIKGRAAGEYHWRMRKGAATIAMHIRFDSIGFDRDSLRLWIGNIDSKGTDIRVAEEYLNVGNYAAVETTLENISTKFELTVDELTDLEEVKFIFRLLMQYPMGLDEEAQNLLLPIAEQGNGDASCMAKNILTRYNRHYPTEYYLPETFYTATGGEKGFGNNNIKNLTLPKETLLVYPNPAKEYTIFSKKNSKKREQLIITDSMGKVVWSHSFALGDTAVKWNTEKIENGIYFYKYMQGSELFNSGKIIILK